MRGRPILTGLAALALCLPFASGQNLLTNNAGFELTTEYYTPGWGYPQGQANVLPGWRIWLDPSGDGYAGAANNQSPLHLEGNNFGYIYSGTGEAARMETAPQSRAPAAELQLYTLWFRARGDSAWGEAQVTVSLTWHRDALEESTLAETNLSLLLPMNTDPNSPMQFYHVTAPAPPGAAFAGARISRPAYNYAAAIFDDFVLMCEPVAPALTLTRAAGGVLLSWPRTTQYRLETAPRLEGPWLEGPTPAPLQTTNWLEMSSSDPARYFRLAPIE